MSHRYGFMELESSISEYLKAILNKANVCMIYDLANVYSLTSLCNVCKEFIDRNAQDILQSEAFLSLSQVTKLVNLAFKVINVIWQCSILMEVVIKHLLIKIVSICKSFHVICKKSFGYLNSYFYTFSLLFFHLVFRN